MHTICMLSLKGGAGKSTVVQSLAVCATQHGQNTLIVELDPQGTLKNWSKRRDKEHPRVHQTLPQSLNDVLDEAAANDTHWVFLDTPGHDTSTAAAAAAHADLIIIPCKIQSTKDFDSVMATLAEANRANKPAYVLMNQVPPNSPKLVRNKQVEIQQEYEVAVLSKYLSRRADFEYCDELGLSAAEYNPDGAAAEEITRLYSLLQSIFITLKPERTKPSQLQSLPASSSQSGYRTETLRGLAPPNITSAPPSNLERPRITEPAAIALPRSVELPQTEDSETENFSERKTNVRSLLRNHTRPR